MAQQERKKDNNIQSFDSRLNRADGFPRKNLSISRREALKVMIAAGTTALVDHLNIFGQLRVEAADVPVDPDISGVEFYNQTRGDAPPEYGYTIQGEFLNAFYKFGGIPMLGYPVSQEFTIDGIRYQATQNVFLQLFGKEVYLANLADMLYEKGYDDALLNMGIPRHFDGDDGSNGQIELARKIRSAWMNHAPIRNMYYRNPNDRIIPNNIWDPIVFYGLPTSMPERMGPFITQRFQRTAILHWVEAVLGGQPIGTVQFANLGDIAKQLGLIPREATIPVHKDTREPWIKIVEKTPEEIMATLPPLPLGVKPIPFTEVERISVLDAISIGQRFQPPNAPRDFVNAGGELVSAPQIIESESKAILHIRTNRNNPNEIYEVILEPKPGYPLWIDFGKNGFIRWYDCTDIKVLKAILQYFHVDSGYPIAAQRTYDGKIMNPAYHGGYHQKLVIHVP